MSKNKHRVDDMQAKQILADDCYKYMEHIAEIIYKNEERREDSIIQQASHMQTAFSFVIAAVFMAVPIMIDHRGSLSMNFFFFAISSISFFLLSSLVFATMAQNRRKREDFPKIEAIRDQVEDEYELFRTIASREKYLVVLYEKVHGSLEKSNNTRIRWVRFSMVMFYIAIALCVFWYLVAVTKNI